MEKDTCSNNARGEKWMLMFYNNHPIPVKVEGYRERQRREMDTIQAEKIFHNGW